MTPLSLEIAREASGVERPIGSSACRHGKRLLEALGASASAIFSPLGANQFRASLSTLLPIEAEWRIGHYHAPNTNRSTAVTIGISLTSQLPMKQPITHQPNNQCGVDAADIEAQPVFFVEPLIIEFQSPPVEAHFAGSFRSSAVIDAAASRVSR